MELLRRLKGRATNLYAGRGFSLAFAPESSTDCGGEYTRNSTAWPPYLLCCVVLPRGTGQLLL